MYGEWYTPPRRGARGPLPAPRKRPPAGRWYAVVVKERDGSRVVRVITRLIYGTEEQLNLILRMAALFLLPLHGHTTIG